MNFNVKIEGMRLDKFLAAETELTRSQIQRYIEEGHVLVNGKVRPKRYALKSGDTVEFDRPPPVSADALPEEIPLDIVYEDADIIVVNKPRGMVAHISAGHYSGTLVNALLYHCRGKLSGINGVLRPGIVHRLDKDTSGLMVAAKNDSAHISLARQLSDRTIERIYHAIVIGEVREDNFTIDLNIARHAKDRKKQAVINPFSGDRRDGFRIDSLPGKRAITHIRVLKRFAKHSLIEARLETGRTHQIRVSLAHIGHAVLGDETYGKSGKNGGGYGGQILHAKTLELLHPIDGKTMRFDSKWPEYFAAAYKKIQPSKNSVMVQNSG